MKIQEKMRKPMMEAKYLNVENTERYRPIIRLFYLKYEKLKYWLYQEEVCEELKDDPSFAEEVQVVKSTTSDAKVTVNPLFTAQQIIDFQHLIRRVPVADNVIEYAVSLVSKTRPSNDLSNDFIKNYIDWGAGPRASQNLILGAKANAAINGKYSPDIEDVQAVATGILRHRIVKNYKADAEGISEEQIIKKLF